MKWCKLGAKVCNKIPGSHNQVTFTLSITSTVRKSNFQASVLSHGATIWSNVSDMINLVILEYPDHHIMTFEILLLFLILQLSAPADSRIPPRWWWSAYNCISFPNLTYAPLKDCIKVSFTAQTGRPSSGWNASSERHKSSCQSIRYTLLRTGWPLASQDNFYQPHQRRSVYISLLKVTDPDWLNA